MVLILFAAGCFALRQIISRMVAGDDPVVTTVSYTALTSMILLTLPLPFVWQTPTASQIPLLIAAALLAAGGEVLIIKSLELADAVVLAPVH